MIESINKGLLNKQKIIMLLTTIAVVGTVLDSLTYFMIWDSRDGLSIYLPDGVTLLSFVVRLAPCLLFSIYIYKYHSHFKAAILIPLAYICVAVSPILSFVDVIRYEYNFPLFELIVHIAVIATFSLASFCSIKGIISKPSLIAAVIAGVLMEAAYLENVSWYMEDDIYLFAISTIIGFIGQVSLYAAMLIFGVHNTLSTMAINEATNISDLKVEEPEQELRLLKEKFDLGVITEEDYRLQRAEIISKL